jgi:pimeloyl-ACP methyl ester carboxylesterase
MPAPDELRRLIADPTSTHPSVQNWMAFAMKDTAVSRAWTLEALSGGFFLPSNRYRWELTSTDLSDALKELEVPVLAISSRHDEGSPMRTFPAITQWGEVKLRFPSIPLAVVTFEQTRHYVSADAPAGFDRALADFLALHSPRGKRVGGPE